MYTIFVEDIRRSERPNYYDVDVSIAGDRKTFTFEVRGVRIISRNADSELAYDDFTANYPMSSDLASVLCDFHKGERVAFPVDVLKYAIAHGRYEGE